MKLNSPKVLLNFSRSDLNTGQTKGNKKIFGYILNLGLITCVRVLFTFTLLIFQNVRSLFQA